MVQGHTRNKIREDGIPPFLLKRGGASLASAHPACFHCTFVPCPETARKKLRYTKALISPFTPPCSVLASINIFYMRRFCYLANWLSSFSSLEGRRWDFAKSFFDFLSLFFKLSSRGRYALAVDRMVRERNIDRRDGIPQVHAVFLVCFCGVCLAYRKPIMHYEWPRLYSNN